MRAPGGFDGEVGEAASRSVGGSDSVVVEYATSDALIRGQERDVVRIRPVADGDQQLADGQAVFQVRRFLDVEEAMRAARDMLEAHESWAGIVFWDRDGSEEGRWWRNGSGTDLRSWVREVFRYARGSDVVVEEGTSQNLGGVSAQPAVVIRPATPEDGAPQSSPRVALNQLGNEIAHVGQIQGGHLVFALPGRRGVWLVGSFDDPEVEITLQGKTGGSTVWVSEASLVRGRFVRGHDPDAVAQVMALADAPGGEAAPADSHLPVGSVVGSTAPAYRIAPAKVRAQLGRSVDAYAMHLTEVDLLFNWNEWSETVYRVLRNDYPDTVQLQPLGFSSKERVGLWKLKRGGARFVEVDSPEADILLGKVEAPAVELGAAAESQGAGNVYISAAAAAETAAGMLEAHERWPGIVLSNWGTPPIAIVWGRGRIPGMDRIKLQEHLTERMVDNSQARLNGVVVVQSDEPFDKPHELKTVALIRPATSQEKEFGTVIDEAETLLADADEAQDVDHAEQAGALFTRLAQETHSDNTGLVAYLEQVRELLDAVGQTEHAAALKSEIQAVEAQYAALLPRTEKDFRQDRNTWRTTARTHDKQRLRKALNPLRKAIKPLRGKWRKLTSGQEEKAGVDATRVYLSGLLRADQIGFISYPQPDSRKGSQRIRAGLNPDWVYTRTLDAVRAAFIALDLEEGDGKVVITVDREKRTAHLDPSGQEEPLPLLPPAPAAPSSSVAVFANQGLALGVPLTQVAGVTGAFVTTTPRQTTGLQELGIDPTYIFPTDTFGGLEEAASAATEFLAITAGLQEADILTIGVNQLIGPLAQVLESLFGIQLTQGALSLWQGFVNKVDTLITAA